MKQKKNFLSFFSGIVIFIIQFFCIRCKVRLDIKEFVERELAKDYSNTIVFYDTSKTGYNNIVYVPSIKEITGTVNIKNEYNVGYTAHLTLDNPSQASCFNKAPEITVTEAGKFQFTFQFNASADAGGTEDNTGGKGAMVPVTVKLIKKEGGALFAEKRFTIRCNTPPAPLQVSSLGDSFTLKRDANPIHHDISLVTCALAINNNSQKVNKIFSSGDFASGKTSFIVKKLLKTPPNNVLLYNASGKRTLTGFVTDTVGLRSEEFSCEGDYRYSDKTNLKVKVAESIGNTTGQYKDVTFMITGTETGGTSINFPYRLGESTFKIKIDTLGENASLKYAATSYSQGNEIPVSVTDNDTNNQKTLDLVVTSEDESSKKTYKLTVGRQDGFKVTVNPTASAGQKPCNVSITLGGNLKKINSLQAYNVHKGDLDENGRLSVKIVPDSDSNLVSKISANKTTTDPDDPGASAVSSFYGYNLKVPMVQAQELTFTYDDKIIKETENPNEATKIKNCFPITLDPEYGQVRLHDMTAQGGIKDDALLGPGFNGTIDFSREPLCIIEMFGNPRNTYNQQNPILSEGDQGQYVRTDSAVKKIIFSSATKFICSGAFKENEIEELSFPDGFEGEIAEDAFHENNTITSSIITITCNNSPRYEVDAKGMKDKQSGKYVILKKTP